MKQQLSLSPASILCLSIFLTILAGCGDSTPSADTSATHSHDDVHRHSPPHGGTPVQLGNEVYHLELVPDPPANQMLAYLYDGHFHDLVMVAETNFTLQARFSNRVETLSFNRLPDPATGKRAEKSALFAARVDWLKDMVSFDGMLPSVELGGRGFTNVTFSFPKGTVHSH
ncbi:MAG: hypothetical protein J0M24_03665 [Verrucomicrobia bacterium]|nr:hypothetical protein [Verrucomicrobiota bacterium]